MDPDKKLLVDEGKKERDARRRDRERKHREGKDPKKPSRKLDIIDQLDATSIFGTGRKFLSLLYPLYYAVGLTGRF